MRCLIREEKKAEDASQVGIRITRDKAKEEEKYYRTTALRTLTGSKSLQLCQISVHCRSVSNKSTFSQERDGGKRYCRKEGFCVRSILR